MRFGRIVLMWLWSLTLLIAQDDIIFFNESPDAGGLYDAPWGFKKSPSYLELNGDKFPVDNLHPYLGSHSLRLHWISKSGGDWGIAVASVGWKGHDLTGYDSLTWWVNAPDEINQADLPSLCLEDLSNKKSSPIFMGDYVNGIDGDSTQWQKISIPIQAFTSGTSQCDFTKIKTIFHMQRAVDEGEHRMWIDEIRAIKAGSGPGTAPAAPRGLKAQGADGRVDLQWNENTESDLMGYFVYRSESRTGVYTRLNDVFHSFHFYCDFSGLNNRNFFYYVVAINKSNQESLCSDTVEASTRAFADDDELLNSVQAACFRYFYDYGHPVSGLARERKGSGETCTSGGTGFGLFTMMVGAERGFAPRDSIAARILKILTFLQDSTPRYHGAWAHWINGTTGQTIPFSTYDDAGDLVETAYLVEGILAIRQYFDQTNPVETEIRSRSTALWESVEWDWYRKNNSPAIYWHWSPQFAWQMNFPIYGFNECMIVYLLAIASPTHSVPASLYQTGWTSQSYYSNGKSFYGYKQWVGWDRGGPLFFTHYSFLGFDPRNKRDQYCNYFENNRNISLINRAWCIENKENHPGYDSLVWGLTASDNPWGYAAQEPTESGDNGTITPTAALSAMPYIPTESMASLKHFYYVLGPNLFGEFGFRDAFNPGQNWYANSFLAIDQGTIAPMIENARTELCWTMFMKNPEIQAMLSQVFTVTGTDEPVSVPKPKTQLNQNYPNPFNSKTMLGFTLEQTAPVTLEIFSMNGTRVLTVYRDEIMNAGFHNVILSEPDLSSGIYFCCLKTDRIRQIKKMTYLK